MSSFQITFRNPQNGLTFVLTEASYFTLSGGQDLKEATFTEILQFVDLATILLLQPQRPPDDIFIFYPDVVTQVSHERGMFNVVMGAAAATILVTTTPGPVRLTSYLVTRVGPGTQPEDFVEVKIQVEQVVLANSYDQYFGLVVNSFPPPGTPPPPPPSPPVPVPINFRVIWATAIQGPPLFDTNPLHLLPDRYEVRIGGQDELVPPNAIPDGTPLNEVIESVLQRTTKVQITFVPIGFLIIFNPSIANIFLFPVTVPFYLGAQTISQLLAQDDGKLASQLGTTFSNGQLNFKPAVHGSSDSPLGVRQQISVFSRVDSINQTLLMNFASIFVMLAITILPNTVPARFFIPNLMVWTFTEPDFWLKPIGAVDWIQIARAAYALPTSPPPPPDLSTLRPFFDVYVYAIEDNPATQLPVDPSATLNDLVQQVMLRTLIPVVEVRFRLYSLIFTREDIPSITFKLIFDFNPFQAQTQTPTFAALLPLLRAPLGIPDSVPDDSVFLSFRSTQRSKLLSLYTIVEGGTDAELFVSLIPEPLRLFWLPPSESTNLSFDSSSLLATNTVVHQFTAEEYRQTIGQLRPRFRQIVLEASDGSPLVGDLGPFFDVYVQPSSVNPITSNSVPTPDSVILGQIINVLLFQFQEPVISLISRAFRVRVQLLTNPEIGTELSYPLVSLIPNWATVEFSVLSLLNQLVQPTIFFREVSPGGPFQLTSRNQSIFLVVQQQQNQVVAWDVNPPPMNWRLLSSDGKTIQLETVITLSRSVWYSQIALAIPQIQAIFFATTGTAIPPNFNLYFIPQSRLSDPLPAFPINQNLIWSDAMEAVLFQFPLEQIYVIIVPLPRTIGFALTTSPGDVALFTFPFSPTTPVPSFQDINLSVRAALQISPTVSPLVYISYLGQPRSVFVPLDQVIVARAGDTPQWNSGTPVLVAVQPPLVPTLIFNLNENTPDTPTFAGQTQLLTADMLQRVNLVNWQNIILQETDQKIDIDNNFSLWILPTGQSRFGIPPTYSTNQPSGVQILNQAFNDAWSASPDLNGATLWIEYTPAKTTQQQINAWFADNKDLIIPSVAIALALVSVIVASVV